MIIAHKSSGFDLTYNICLYYHSILNLKESYLNSEIGRFSESFTAQRPGFPCKSLIGCPRSDFTHDVSSKDNLVHSYIRLFVRLIYN